MMKVPPAQKLDEFQYEPVMIEGLMRHLQTYLVYFEDPELPPSRHNAMDLRSVQIQEYWKEVDKFEEEKEEEKLKLDEEGEARAAKFEEALRQKKRLLQSGRELFTGCGGNEASAILASIQAKIANMQAKPSGSKKQPRPKSPEKKKKSNTKSKKAGSSKESDSKTADK